MIILTISVNVINCDSLDDAPQQQKMYFLKILGL